MLSNEEICRRLPGHPGYEQLKTQRRRVAFAFASVCLGLCMAFILAAVMSPASLAVPLNREGTLTSGVACATGLIALSWGLTGIYIHIANTRFDAQCKRLLSGLQT
ncbi:DUF485 domain-containing protein [Comamonas thiooxydans]|uniref:DUF485 domain-containing protein n=1 Tax=Comamonas thiooxydans TaxID=363952 RepID=UPI0007C487FA|nr:DUF485 domain-containing protein [Comamonas thiooxydans]MCO8249856.1 DUF485 domain-containing protein [Comamonas thiooxydans]OAD85711.1 hypothetical protein ATN89_03155 [Comamonas thiooxydans]UBQ44209.1 DUF485 domain-containing protein [Comamonas thiooxydans]